MPTCCWRTLEQWCCQWRGQTSPSRWKEVSGSRGQCGHLSSPSSHRPYAWSAYWRIDGGAAMMLMRPISYISIKPDSPDSFRVKTMRFLHVWQLGESQIGVCRSQDFQIPYHEWIWAKNSLRLLINWNFLWPLPFMPYRSHSKTKGLPGIFKKVKSIDFP